MTQYYQLFNLSKGLVMPIKDGSKYIEKSISIDALIFLLQEEWKGDKIIMIGDYNEESKQYTQEFLSVYGLSYEGEDNLYTLWSDGYLPKNAYEEVLWTKKMKEFSDPFTMISKILDKEKDKDQSDYFMTTKKKVRLEKMKTDDIYVFVNHTKKEYVKFDEEFFQGFYTTDYSNDMRKRIYMTIPYLCPVVRNIVEGLIAHKNKHSDYKRVWSGRFSGDSLSFMKESHFSMISDYTNIYHELSREDYYFQTFEKLEDVIGKKGWIMCSDHIQYDKDFFESDKEEE